MSERVETKDAVRFFSGDKLMLTVHKPCHDRYDGHVRGWENCERCPLHQQCHRHVLVRGEVPADILLIGEAPGTVEDTLGYPFIGPAGKVLDELLKQSFYKIKYTYAITNTVACIPWDATGDGVRPPTDKEQEQCLGRVQEVHGMVNPRGIVLMGKTAQGSLYASKNGNGDTPILEVYHPAYILRQGRQKSVHFRRWVDNFVRFVKEVKNG